MSDARWGGNIYYFVIYSDRLSLTICPSAGGQIDKSQSLLLTAQIKILYAVKFYPVLKW